MNNQNITEDIVLIKETLAGKKEAFGHLVNKYKNSIFNLAYRLSGSYHDAEDVSQETFLQAYKKLKEFKIGLKFHTWLYTIALNICRNKLKRKSILKVVSLDKPIATEDSEVIWEIPDKNASPEEILIQKEERKRIGEKVHALPLKYRSVFLLRYTEGLTYEEISQVTGLPLGTVEVRLFRARTILIKSLSLWKKLGKK